MSTDSKGIATEPCKVEDVQGDGRWTSMHERFCHTSRDKEADVIFIGDSIAMLMQDSAAWDKHIAPFHCFNFGIGGDATQHIIWRIQNGELDSVQTKVVVIWCGTNNHGHTGDQIGDGLFEITNEVLKRQPGCKILILSILPRGEKPNKLRERNKQANNRIKELIKNHKCVSYLDVSEGFVQEDGLISHMDMIDYLHLTRHSYDKIVPKISEAIHNLIPEYD